MMRAVPAPAADAAAACDMSRRRKAGWLYAPVRALRCCRLQRDALRQCQPGTCCPPKYLELKLLISWRSTC